MEQSLIGSTNDRILNHPKADYEMNIFKTSLMCGALLMVVHANSKENIKLKNVYKEIFKINTVKYDDQFYLIFDINTIDSSNVLHEYTVENYYYLNYLLKICVSYNLKAMQNRYNDKPKLDSIFYAQIKSDAQFNQAFLPSVYQYLSERGMIIEKYRFNSVEQMVNIDELLKLGVRFFFPDKVEENTIKARICVGINGIKDYTNRNCALEAFVFSAIFNNVVNEDRFGVYKKYKEILNELSALNLSTDDKTTIQRAQGAMWYELYKYQPFKKVFLSEYERIGKWMNFKLVK